PYNTGFRLDSAELPSNSGTEYEMGNLAHRPRTKGGYFPVPPVDSAQDIRSEMLSVMAEMGVVVEKHHHEVASAQHELGIKFGPMTQLADAMQIYKYADLSDTCLHYIGGILKHAKTINAFTNPTTNSYKRLVPGYEAPVLLAYSARNRSASCRIPV